MDAFAYKCMLDLNSKSKSVAKHGYEVLLYVKDYILEKKGVLKAELFTSHNVTVALQKYMYIQTSNLMRALQISSEQEHDC